MMAATVLEDLGYKAVNLGPNTPVAAFLEAVDFHQAQLVWIAATSGHAFVDDLHEWERFIATLQERAVRVVLGGQALQRMRMEWSAGVQVMESMAELAAFGEAVRREHLSEANNLN